MLDCHVHVTTAGILKPHVRLSRSAQRSNDLSHGRPDHQRFAVSKANLCPLKLVTHHSQANPRTGTFVNSRWTRILRAKRSGQLGQPIEQSLMPRPFSASRIERLGARLAKKPGPPNPADLAQLLELLSTYSVALDQATERVRDAIGFAPSARVKNTGTILEKLDRYGGSWLKSIQDLAGMRLVRSQSRAEQDTLTAEILGIFDSDSKSPKVIDRRVAPIQGYRAVHVVVYPDGFPIEIQIRTQMQHEWAEMFEKVADVLGRGIRYGEPPRHWLIDHAAQAINDPGGEALRQGAEALAGLPGAVIEVADVIDVIERAERDKPLEWSDGDVRAGVLKVGETLDTVLEAVDRIPSSSLPHFPAEDPR